MEALAVLFILIPLILALLIPVVSRFFLVGGWVLAFLGTAATAILSFLLLKNVWFGGDIQYWLAGWEPPWGIEYRLDVLNCFVLIIVSFMAFVTALYAKESVEREIPVHQQGLFYSMFMLHLTGLNGIIITGDLFNLYVFLEITALSGYALIAVGRSRRAKVASLHYLVLGTIGATFYLLGLGYLYLTTGTLNMADLFQRLTPIYQNPGVITGFALISLGLFIKLALFPLHTWQPGAYGEAPSAVSALLASTGTKVSAYVLIRVLYSVFTPDFYFRDLPFQSILLGMSLVTIIAGSVLALAQTDIKRMLAYSSMGQIGYILLGISIGSEKALTGSLVHIFNHALMKGALFFVAGSVFYRVGTTLISNYRGLGKRMPLTAFSFTLAACSMAGLPGTAGFISKWYLATSALDEGYWFVVPVLILSSLLTAIYFFKVINSIYFDGELIQKREEAPVALCLPTFAVSFLCLLFGVMAFVPLQIAGRAANQLLKVI
ncbi:MAG: monovalent cation/H+ antiporter subunit D family protein [Nitrospinota bacterium]